MPTTTRTARRWVIIGAGYTGGRVVDALRARGDDVVATRRREGFDLATVGVDDVAAVVRGASVVVLTAPPSDANGAAEVRLAEAAAREGVARIVYISSTGVYAAAAGALVDESWPIEPRTASGRARLAAENALAAGAVPCVRLRAAGIYGPDRGVLARLRAGTYRIIGDGTTYVSRVHVEDLAAAVILAGDAAAPSPVYNVADDDPCSSLELATAACAALGVAMPPLVPLDQVDADVAGMFTADRRIDNGRLARELGWRPRYPSWRAELDT
ncbi:MAG TPA: NAD-dependent epimerase/dehydratase family protein [Kofleriaceae bacterium]|nr:NAD-dependent epimerase/dehydratase family protein [Kofleriaceae bacterium]